MKMHCLLTKILTGAALLVSTSLFASPAWAEGCRFNKGRYELVGNKDVGLLMLPPSNQSAVQLARVRITHGGVTKLKGVLTASSGYSALYFIAEHKELEEKTIVFSFFDAEMRLSSDNAKYLVSQGFPRTLYYNDRELWNELSLTGEAWRLVACR